MLTRTRPSDVRIRCIWFKADISEKVRDVFPYFWELHPLFIDRSAFNPVAAHSTGDADDDAWAKLTARATGIRLDQKRKEPDDQVELLISDNETPSKLRSTPRSRSSTSSSPSSGFAAKLDDGMISIMHQQEIRQRERDLKQSEIEERRLASEDLRETRRIELEERQLTLQAARDAAEHRRWWVGEYSKYRAEGKDDDWIRELLGPRDPL